MNPESWTSNPFRILKLLNVSVYQIAKYYKSFNNYIALVGSGVRVSTMVPKSLEGYKHIQSIGSLFILHSTSQIRPPNKKNRQCLGKQ